MLLLKIVTLEESLLTVEFCGAREYLGLGRFVFAGHIERHEKGKFSLVSRC